MKGSAVHVKPEVIEKVIEIVKEVQVQIEEATKSEIKSAKDSKLKEESSRISGKKVSEIKAPAEKEEVQEKKVSEIKKEEPVKEEEVDLPKPQREIYELMIEFFGSHNKDKYPGFIKKNSKFDKERIMQMWIEQSNIFE